jgi:hypothetical protein
MGKRGAERDLNKDNAEEEEEEEIEDVSLHGHRGLDGS